MDLKNYRAVTLRDLEDDSVIYAIILLNNKHSVKEFQNEIDRILEEEYEDISIYGDDWELVKENINEKFDWQELDMEDEDYLEI